MELLGVVQVLVKNPLLDISILDDSMLGQDLIESYKNSETQKIRKLLAEKNEFSDMSHVIPFSDMSHVFSVVK